MKQNEYLKTKQEKIITREKNINEIAKLIMEHGVYRVVVHGETITLPDGTKQIAPSPDLDTLGALYLLNNSFKATSKASVVYNEGSYTEVVPKGSITKDAVEEVSEENDNKKVKIILHIDTGGKELSVDKKENGIIHVFIDHHSEEKDASTSATALMAEILKQSGWIKEFPAWMNKFINSVTQIDNLTYLDETLNGKKLFNEHSAVKRWPESIFGLHKELPFNFIKKVYETDRNPWRPFTDQELMGNIGDTMIKDKDGKEHDLRKLIEERRKEMMYTIGGVKKAIWANEQSNIKTSTPELGRVVYHNFAQIPDNKKAGKTYTNKIPGELGFIAIKALDYDTYVSFNPKNKSFLINSTKEQSKIVTDRLKEIAPGTQIIRGVMVYSPKQPIEGLTEELFLKTIGLID